MKFILSLFFFSIITLNAQITIEEIFHKNYNDLPFNLRIENSGIYAISSFDINKTDIAFKTYDDSHLYIYQRETEVFKKEKSLLTYDAILSSSKNRLEKFSKIEEEINPKIIKRIYASQSNSIAEDKNGKLFIDDEIAASVKVNPDKLEIYSKFFEGKSKEINFPNSLGYASILGIDKYSNHFILVEEIQSHIPLKVSRKVIVLNSFGKKISSLNVPLVKYLSLLKEFQIDEEGNLYHLYSEPEKFSILKISGLTTSAQYELNYPSEYQKEIHFNNFVTTDEYEGDQPQEIKAKSSRLTAIKLGEKYVLHKYLLRSYNLAPSNITAPDGDIIKTPAWLVEGVNSKIPYKWGGFQTLEQFDGQLPYKRYAGDIHTSGVSLYSVGVDCSGFVSRCWQLTYHSATSMMGGISTQYDNWNLMKPGDAILKVGHVRLFVERNDDGSFKVVESSARDWGVSYWSYTPSELSSYIPICYNNMEDDYTFNRPELLSAEINSESDIKLSWSADTVGVSSFKIYGSSNGESWTEILSIESDKTSALIPSDNNYYSFRISSVMNNSVATEGNWSNVLSASYNSENKILIVDGFARDNGSGSWQGAGHTFVNKYASAINELNQSFESVKSSSLIDGSIELQDYKSIFWILGDESTVFETLNSNEQNMIKTYLESGGNLFISGSEVGWDLSYKGSDEDKLFYADYLKAEYVSDDAGTLNAVGVEGTLFDGLSIRFGQTYEEDFPDVINPINGASLAVKFSNNKGAGISYEGSFGSSASMGKVIYLSFPVETIANDTVFNSIITKSSDFFDNVVNVENKNEFPSEFTLSQNYPNPFNPETIIEYSVPQSMKGEMSNVKLIVYDVLGNKVAVLVNEEKAAGNYVVRFNAEDLSSGVYFYTMNNGNFMQVKKMLLIK